MGFFFFFFLMEKEDELEDRAAEKNRIENHIQRTRPFSEAFFVPRFEGIDMLSVGFQYRYKTVIAKYLPFPFL